MPVLVATPAHLPENSEIFRTAFEQAPSGMCMGSLDGRLQQVNAALCRMLGYSEEELLNLGWRGTTHPADLSLTLEASRQITSGQLQFAEFEKRYIHRDGHTVWARVKFSLHSHSQGNAQYIVAHIDDITERRRSEDALRHSEEKYRRLVMNLPDVIWTSDSHGRLTYVSPNVMEMSGFTPEELLEKGRVERLSRIHPADVLLVTEAFTELFEKHKAFDIEYQMQRKDGVWIWVRDRALRTFEDQGRVFADGVFTDITARHRAEDALAESERRYRLLFERNLAGVYRAFPDGRLMDCNDAVLKLLGFDSVAEFRELSVGDLFYDANEGRETFRRLFRDCSLTNFDIRLRRKDGTPIWTLENVNLIADEAGRPVIEGTFVDITDRKQAEEALRHGEQRYRELISNMPDVLWTADAQAAPVFVSPNSERVFGFCPEEMCRPGFWFSRIHSDDLAAVHESYVALFDGAQDFLAEYRFQRKDGEWIWCRGRALMTYRTGGKDYTDGIVSDISEQKRSFLLAERLQRRNELILHSAAEGILGLDVNGSITFVNPAAERMLALEGADYIGHDLHELVAHSDSEAVPCSKETCGMLATLRDYTKHHASNDVFIGRGADPFPVEFTSAPKFENGELEGAVVVFRDVTEGLRAHETLQASLKEKEALLREIHHRVKNNLQIVCSLLKLNSRGLQDPFAKQVFEDTQHRVKAMALVHETLYQSQDLAGIDFSAYIPRLAGQLLRSYGFTSGRVQLHLNVESVVLPIDIAVPCALVLTELIANSAKHVFTPQQGGELWIEFRCDEGGLWLLDVRDSGCAGSTVETSSGNTSFGLRLVELLAEQLGGSVRMDREAGFRVVLTFPISEILEAK